MYKSLYEKQCKCTVKYAHLLYIPDEQLSYTSLTSYKKSRSVVCGGGLVGERPGRNTL